MGDRATWRDLPENAAPVGEHEPQITVIDVADPSAATLLASAESLADQRGQCTIRVKGRSPDLPFDAVRRLLEPLVAPLPGDHPVLIGAGGFAYSRIEDEVSPGTADFESIVYGLAWLLLSIAPQTSPVLVVERLDLFDPGSIRVLSVVSRARGTSSVKIIATVGSSVDPAEWATHFPGARIGPMPRPPVSEPQRSEDELLLEKWNLGRLSDSGRLEILPRLTDGLISAGRPQDAADIAEGLLQDGVEGELRISALVAAARAARILLDRRDRSLELTRQLTEMPDTGGEPGRDFLGEVVLEYVNTVQAGRSAVTELGFKVLADGDLDSGKTVEGLGWFFACYAMHLAEANEVALKVLDGAVAEASRRSSLPAFVQAVALRSGPLFHLGYLREAAVDCELALAAGIGELEVWLPAVRSTLIQLRTLAGDLEGAARVATWNREGDESAPSMLYLFGRSVYLDEVGREEEALSGLVEAGELMEMGGGNNPAMMPWRSAAARIHARAGRFGDGLELAEEELVLARQFGADGPIGTALRACALCTEDPMARLELLREAQSCHLKGQRMVERLATEVDLAVNLAALDRKPEARGILLRTMDLAHGSGANSLAEQARTALVAAGGKPRRFAASGPDALTPSEQRVATLAASGLGNREIAEELFVTLKTVEWHLTRSYGKLGITSRSELSASLESNPPGFRSAR